MFDGQRIERIYHRLHPFTVLQSVEGARRRIGAIRFVLDPAPPRLLADKIRRALSGHLPEPRPEALRVAQAGKPPPRVHEHILSDLFAGGNVSYDGEGDGANEIRVAFDERREGIIVPGLCGHNDVPKHHHGIGVQIQRRCRHGQPPHQGRRSTQKVTVRPENDDPLSWTGSMTRNSDSNGGA